MSRLDVARTRELLQGFDFHRVFIEQLGWSQPKQRRPFQLTAAEVEFTLTEIAQLGATVLERDLTWTANARRVVAAVEELSR